jgi:hypothetical protein
VDRSLRRLGQLLVVMGALLGAVLGVALALIVEHAASSRAVVPPGPERAAVLGAGTASSRPPVARAASGGSAAAGDQRAESVGRASQRDGKVDKHRQGRLGKAEASGNDKPGKGQRQR